jgi:hypothetical protein
VRFEQKSTRFGTCDFRKDLDDQDLRFGLVTKPKTFGVKVGTPALGRKIELCVLRGCKPRKPGKNEEKLLAISR